MKWFKRVFGGANDPKDRKDTTNPSPTSSLNVVLQRIGQSNVHPVQTGAELLALVPRIEERRERLFRLSQVDAQLFAQAYWTALESFAEVVQMLPASERHHHSHALGQLEHTIEAVEQAMLRRRSMLLPMGAEPEREADIRSIRLGPMPRRRQTVCEVCIAGARKGCLSPISRAWSNAS